MLGWISLKKNGQKLWKIMKKIIMKNKKLWNTQTYQHIQIIRTPSVNIFVCFIPCHFINEGQKKAKPMAFMVNWTKWKCRRNVGRDWSTTKENSFNIRGTAHYVLDRLPSSACTHTLLETILPFDRSERRDWIRWDRHGPTCLSNDTHLQDSKAGIHSNSKFSNNNNINNNDHTNNGHFLIPLILRTN